MGILPTGTSDWLQFESRDDVSFGLLFYRSDCSTDYSHRNGLQYSYPLWVDCERLDHALSIATGPTRLGLKNRWMLHYNLP